jgi:hypothetical protein
MSHFLWYLPTHVPFSPIISYIPKIGHPTLANMFNFPIPLKNQHVELLYMFSMWYWQEKKHMFIISLMEIFKKSVIDFHGQLAMLICFYNFSQQRWNPMPGAFIILVLASVFNLILTGNEHIFIFLRISMNRFSWPTDNVDMLFSF